MRGAYLISDDEDLAARVWSAMRTLGVTAVADAAQITEGEGKSLSIEGELDEAIAWDWQEGPFEFRGPEPYPEMSRMSALLVQCRSEEMIADWMGRLAALVDVPLWVLDGEGVVWPADDVDPSQVRL